MGEPFKKVTEFHGRASGDMECFCFDKRTHEQQKKDGQLRDFRKKARLNAAARTYPDDLLPEEAKNFQGGVSGRFRITVEFWPDDVSKS